MVWKQISSFIKCKQTDEKVLIANRLRKILSKKMDEYDHYDDDGFDAQEAEMFQDLQDSRPFRPNMRRRVLRRFDPENFTRYRF